MKPVHFYAALLESFLLNHQQHLHHIWRKSGEDLDRQEFIMAITCSLMTSHSDLSLFLQVSNRQPDWTDMHMIQHTVNILFLFWKDLFVISSKVYSWINLNSVDLVTAWYSSILPTSFAIQFSNGFANCSCLDHTSAKFSLSHCGDILPLFEY